MGGVILLVLLILLIVILVTPAIRARLNRDVPSGPRQESPHEEVIRRLDDHRKRRNRPTDDSIPGDKE